MKTELCKMELIFVFQQSSFGPEASEADMFDDFQMDVDEDLHGGGETDPVEAVSRASGSRSSGVLDESLDRHIDRMTEQLLLAENKSIIVPPPVAEQRPAGGDSRGRRGRSRQLAAAATGPASRVTRQRK
jgi:hypothetical protein